MMKKLLSLLGIFLLLSSKVYAVPVIATTKVTFADTIVAKVVSDLYNIPIILIDKDKVTNDTIEELNNLNATEIIIIGGPAVISPNVEEQLKNLGYDVIRLWGVTRYETSAIVAKYFWETSPEAVLITNDLVNEKAKLEDIAIVRQAEDFAINKGIPLLITPVNKLDPNVADAILTLGVSHIYLFTKSRNITNLENELKELGVSVDVEGSSDINKQNVSCKNVVKIAVLKDVDWRTIEDVLAYGRCIKLVVVNDTLNETELQNMNISMIITNKTLIHRFREKIAKKEMIEKAIRARESKIKVLIYPDRMIEDLLKEIALWRSIDNKTANILMMYYNNSLQLLNKGNISEAQKQLMIALKLSRELKWKRKVWIQEERENINRIVEMKKEITKELLKKLYRKQINNIEDISELRHTIQNLTKERYKKFCIQMVVWACNNKTGECKRFGSPCDVPEGWNIVPSPIRINGKVTNNNTEIPVRLHIEGHMNIGE